MEPNVPFPLTDSIKILGVTLCNDFSFAAHIKNVVKTVNASLQTLNGMRRFSENTENRSMLTYVRPILEYACPVWAPSAIATAYLCQELESVQKRAVSIILGSRDIPYEKALEPLELPSLQNQYETLIMSFGKVLLSKSQYRDILHDQSLPSKTRKQDKLVPVKARTNRYGNSFVPVFVDMYNKS